IKNFVIEPTQVTKENGKDILWVELEDLKKGGPLPETETETEINGSVVLSVGKQVIESKESEIQTQTQTQTQMQMQMIQAQIQEQKQKQLQLQLQLQGQREQTEQTEEEIGRIEQTINFIEDYYPTLPFDDEDDKHKDERNGRKEMKEKEKEMIIEEVEDPTILNLSDCNLPEIPVVITHLLGDFADEKQQQSFHVDIDTGIGMGIGIGSDEKKEEKTKPNDGQDQLWREMNAIDLGKEKHTYETTTMASAAYDF
ncbi:putative RTX-family protein-27, partial [Reticulomyxa filosa]